MDCRSDKRKCIDIAIFAEYVGTSVPKVKNKNLQDENYQYYDGYGGCEKISLVAKICFSDQTRREQNRYTIYLYTSDEGVYIIVGIHLPATSTASSSERRETFQE